MWQFKDYQGTLIRLTEERRFHILSHPEMRNLIDELEVVLQIPDRVVQSLSDPQVNLYYRWYRNTPVGEKFLCVVAKFKKKENDAFVITAYLTDTMKKGTVLWLKSV